MRDGYLCVLIAVIVCLSFYIGVVCIDNWLKNTEKFKERDPCQYFQINCAVADDSNATEFVLTHKRPVVVISDLSCRHCRRNLDLLVEIEDCLEKANVSLVFYDQTANFKSFRRAIPRSHTIWMFRGVFAEYVSWWSGSVDRLTTEIENMYDVHGECARETAQENPTCRRRELAPGWPFRLNLEDFDNPEFIEDYFDSSSVVLN